MFREGVTKRWQGYVLVAGPARSQDQGMCGTFMRENRESPCPPAWLGTRPGRSGNAEAVSLG
jgi:hypothetical protein